MVSGHKATTFNIPLCPYLEISLLVHLPIPHTPSLPHDSRSRVSLSSLAGSISSKLGGLAPRRVSSGGGLAPRRVSSGGGHTAEEVVDLMREREERSSSPSSRGVCVCSLMSCRCRVEETTVEPPNKGHYGANNLSFVEGRLYLGGSLVGGSTVLQYRIAGVLSCMLCEHSINQDTATCIRALSHSIREQ